MGGVSLYLRYMGISLRGQMQYRASFVMQSIGQFLITGIEFLGIWALFDRFGSLQGWTLPEVALFYGSVQIAFAVADGIAGGFDQFGTTVKSGDFDRVLLRPRGTVLQILGQELTLRRLGRLSQGLIVLAWAIYALHIRWTAPKAALLAASIAGGTCLFVGLFILQATVAFWTVESLEFANVVTYGGTEAASRPLSIYKPWFRIFFTFVIPLAAVNYLPALAILDRGAASAAGEVMLWCAPLVCVAFLIACCRIWRVGVRHYRSTGS
jgi:ABC-2 type transport system permease protein